MWRPCCHKYLSCLSHRVCIFTPWQVTNTSMFVQGGVMMVNGTAACSASYFIAWAIKELMGDLEMCGAR